VTIRQYLRFRPDAGFGWAEDDERCPANKVSFTDAMKYCRWLSEQEAVPEDQMCYPPVDQIEPRDGTLSDQRLARTGYRLPTEDEWEFAVRAGSTTPWYFGVREADVREFAWCAVNSRERLQPVGSLRPNQFGLFDGLGNVSEWCHYSSPEKVQAGKYVLRGGRYNHTATKVSTGAAHYQPISGYSFTGFRLARSVPAGR
jgi:formylglycine-generating enzyme required for sulfatase activity